MSVKPIRSALLSGCFRVACIAARVLATSGACLAQVAGGTNSGIVKGSSGAVAPAQVAIKNSETGVLRSVDLDEQGIYSAPNLAPGTYEMISSSTGLETVVASSVVVTLCCVLVRGIGTSIFEVGDPFLNPLISCRRKEKLA